MSVSIIVTCEEQQPQLRELLPVLLSQQYEGEYEVIVVDKKHDKDMEEWLEDMESQYPHLSHTFCPASTRGIDVHRLALMLGAKAANFDWLVLLPASACLEGENWLSQLVTRTGELADIVVGITDHKRRWNWFSKYLFLRRFSLFRPTSSIIFCRRSTLLERQNVKFSNPQIIRL